MEEHQGLALGEAVWLAEEEEIQAEAGLFFPDWFPFLAPRKSAVLERNSQGLFQELMAPE